MLKDYFWPTKSNLEKQLQSLNTTRAPRLYFKIGLVTKYGYPEYLTFRMLFGFVSLDFTKYLIIMRYTNDTKN